MKNINFLNKKKIKRILELIKNQWGFEKDLDYLFVQNEKGKIYIASKEIAGIDLDKININSIGMYIAECKGADIRLSIEGSQLIGPHAKKNIVEINNKQTEQWFKGNDLDIKTDCTGFVIIRNNNDFLGTGKVSNNRILNFVPKSRRIVAMVE